MIEVQHITKRYGNVTAVDDVSFRVERGEILGFLGPNGAGKTTTMRILTGYMPPSEGRAMVAGYDLFNDAIAANYWLVNGTQQTEAFNNYKDQTFGAVINPVKSLTWTTNFHMGQEHPDVQPIQTPGAPTIPTQPGLSIVPIIPALDGRLHILDSYATW